MSVTEVDAVMHCTPIEGVWGAKLNIALSEITSTCIIH